MRVTRLRLPSLLSGSTDPRTPNIDEVTRRAAPPRMSH